MKIERNKIIFISIIGLVISFIAGYTYIATNEDKEVDGTLQQPDVPELKEEQKAYNSKLDAVNDIKEERVSNAPSVYDKALLDSTGRYDPHLEEKKRQRIVDSIYKNGRIDYELGNYRKSDGAVRANASESITKPTSPEPIDFAKRHKAFFSFSSSPKSAEPMEAKAETDSFIMVEVSGEQTVKKDSRLELRLAVDALINGDLIARNTLVYGFVSFRTNRVLINITNIKHKPVNLKAFDLLDGNEGIYVKNSFTGEVAREVIGDVVEDINIPGVPQVGGIKQVFRRNNRNVKVTIYNQYQLILKPAL